MRFVPYFLFAQKKGTELSDFTRWTGMVDIAAHSDNHVNEVDYHVQAAADHHVREMHRVQRFVYFLQQEQPSDVAMASAGQCMMESHDSYSHNARLGHPMTDRLALMLSQAGQRHGIFGQRITGGGGGGTLAILLRDVPIAHQTISHIRERYETETGLVTQLFTGSSPGAAAFGIRLYRKESR